MDLPKASLSIPAPTALRGRMPKPENYPKRRPCPKINGSIVGLSKPTSHLGGIKRRFSEPSTPFCPRPAKLPASQTHESPAHAGLSFINLNYGKHYNPGGATIFTSPSANDFKLCLTPPYSLPSRMHKENPFMAKSFPTKPTSAGSRKVRRRWVSNSRISQYCRTAKKVSR